MRRALFLAALVVVAGACELFFPFDIPVDGGADASDTGGGDAGGGDVDASDAAVFDGTLPTTLYSFKGKGISLAGDDASLYWFLSNGGNPKLMITSKDDGGTTVLLADAGLNPNGIVLDDARVYWVTAATPGYPSNASVVALAKDGGAFTVLVSKSDWWPGSIAVDDGNVYVLNPYATAEPLAIRVPKDGGPYAWLEPPTSAYDPYPESITVDDASVYRVHQSIISSYPKDCVFEAGTCVVQPLMVENASDYCVRDIAVDDTGLYWVQSSGSAPCLRACGVYRTPKTGGTVIDAAVNVYSSSSACGKSLALEGAWAYSISYAVYEIIAAAKDGGGSGLVSPPQAGPFNAPVVADSVAIYWIADYNTGNARIMRLAR